MKKTILIILIIVAGAAVYNFFNRAHPHLADFRQFKPDQIVQDLQKQISTPGPLRSLENAPDSNLTAAGVFNLTNQQRLQNNLPALKQDALLDASATAKLKDMFAQQYFEHISPQGKGPADLAKQEGYAYLDIGENLALGNFKDDQALVKAWMNSPGHRANILGTKYTELGVAAGQGIFQGEKVWLAVQEFGRSAAACPGVDESLKSQINSGQIELDSLQAQIQQDQATLQASHPKTQAEVVVYNQEVNNYNNLIQVYNNRIDALKSLVAQYNSEVNAYNRCLAE